MFNKRGQLTVFIIVVVILIASVGLFFTLKDRIDRVSIPKTFEPAYNTFLFCLEENTQSGINLLESQAGYIETPEFEPGSTHMPFSSQLNLFGTGVPYWYYVSGNNIKKEQVPSLVDMQNQLANFVKNQISDCDFSSYYEEGFQIERGRPQVEVLIRDNNVETRVSMNLAMASEGESTLVTAHKVVVDSKLGELYGSAREIYASQKNNLFLEEYALDVLRLYAPVDGFDISCSPKIWNADEVFDDLQSAVQDNTLFLKTKGGDYVLNDENDEYFVLDLSSKSNVRFLNSKNWPSSYEVAPSEGNILIAEPVGNQPELGALGFCYVPYHFVYNMKYPVLVQVSEGSEIFQFPVAVIVQGNKPGKALEGFGTAVESIELCEYKNTPMSVNVRGSDGGFLNAEIYYECFGETCRIGESPLYEEFPQCTNGYVIAKAEGYDEGKRLFSTVSSGSIDMVLNKLYGVEINLKMDGLDYSDSAIITFISDENVATVVYPEQKKVELSANSYDIQVYVYGNASLRFESETYEQCVEVPSSGFFGLFGGTEEECFEIDVPSSDISTALIGGGNVNHFFTEFNLKNSNILDINAKKLPSPTTLEQLQQNYILFENNQLEVNLI